MRRQLSDLQCYLLPAKKSYCQNQLLFHYEKTILFWHHIIQNALLEEKNTNEAKHLTHDLFLQNNEAVVLFDAENPIGLFMFQWIDIQNSDKKIILALEKRFSKKLVDQLREKKIKYVMLMGQLAVQPAWRKSSIGYGVTDILMGFAVTRFLESKAAILLTTTRNNRRTHDLCYRQGGKKFSDNKKVFHVDSDIVLFERHDVKPLEFQTLQNITQQLWKNKINGWIDIPLSFVNDVPQTIT